MKTIKYRKSIGIILTIACGFTSLTNTGCDDFLSEKEVPRITSDFYKTEQGILAAIDATYAYMRFGVGGEFSNVLTELGTDLITGAEGALSYPYIVQLCHQQNRNCIVCGKIIIKLSE